MDHLSNDARYGADLMQIGQSARQYYGEPKVLIVKYDDTAAYDL